MKKHFGRFLAVLCMLVMVITISVIMTAQAQAALVFPTITLDDVNTIAAGMIGLLGAVWALKKALGFLGR